MKTDKYYIMVFDSTHYAIKVDGMLKQKGLEGEIIPTPRDIDSSCGLSIRFPGDILKSVTKIVNIKENRVRLYKSEKDMGRTVYTQQEM